MTCGQAKPNYVIITASPIAKNVAGGILLHGEGPSSIGLWLITHMPALTAHKPKNAHDNCTLALVAA